jgi:uncharacterized protein (UPF0333 family)
MELKNLYVVIDVERIRGQASVELLIILGFFMIVLIPIIIFAFNVSIKENWKISLQRDRDALTGLAKSANDLVAIGKDNSAVYTVYFSSSVKNLTSIKNVLILKEEIPEVGDIDQVVILDKEIVLGDYICNNNICEYKEVNAIDAKGLKGLNNFELIYSGYKNKIVIKRLVG